MNGLNTDEVYDPFDPAICEYPYEAYRLLRDEHPVYRNESTGFWALSRFEDVWNAVHDPATFSSASGIFVSRQAEDRPEMRAMMPMIIEMDPPRHDELRSLVSRAWTPRRIGALEVRIREIAANLLDGLDASQAQELVGSVAGVLPTMVIAELLGVPEQDWPLFRQWSTQLVQFDPGSQDKMRAAYKGVMELYTYLAGIVAERRAAPRDDLVSELIAAEEEGQRLDEAELMGFCLLLLVAGNETTTNLISNATVLLADHPDQRRFLVEHPDAIGTATEEFLRFDSPVQALGRCLTRPVEMHGERLEAGDRILLLFGSANRDERELADPNRLDVTRRTDRHLAFGHGIHYCLGASLARLEGRVMFEELLARFPDYEVDQSQAERLHSGPIRGYLRLPVLLGRRAAA